MEKYAETVTVLAQTGNKKIISEIDDMSLQA